jgi:hypothetical protein
MALRLRRGTDAERQSITPLAGELIYTTDTKELYVGDGTTIGGLLVSASLSDDATPTLSANLNLNGHDIVGNGNININGTISATGNINLGDGVEDNVIVGGQIGSSLIPGTTDSYNLGDSLARWNEVHARNMFSETATVDGEAFIGSIVTDGNIIKSDSTIIYNAATDTLTVKDISAYGVIEAAGFVGSVFSDSSSTIIDGVKGLVVGDVSNTNTISENVTITKNLVIEDPVEGLAGIVINNLGDIDSSYDLFRINSRTTTGIGALISYWTARGTMDVPTASQQGDEIINWAFGAYDSDDQTGIAALLTAKVSGAISSGITPGTIDIQTQDESGNLVSALSVDHEQIIEVADNKLGINSGSGTADITGGPTEALLIRVNGVEYALPLYGLVP